MFITHTHKTSLENKPWRSKVFPLLAGILTAVLFLAGSFEFLPAWILRDPADDVHLWHIAELGALAAIFLGGMMFALVRRSTEKPLLAQFMIVSTFVLAIGIMPFDIKGAGLLIVTALIAVTYPKPSALISFSREGSVSKLMLGLSIVLAFFLFPIAWKEIQWQIIGMAQHDLHALYLHWIGSALLILLLLLAGVMASTKRPGWKQLAVITGVTYGYMGVIALILQSDYAGSWGGAGGLFAIIAGIWYIIFAMLEAHKAEKALAESDELESTQEESMTPVIMREVLPAHTTRQLVEASR